jgi:hypothetical protein
MIFRIAESTIPTSILTIKMLLQQLLKKVLDLLSVKLQQQNLCG